MRSGLTVASSQRNQCLCQDCQSAADVCMNVQIRSKAVISRPVTTCWLSVPRGGTHPHRPCRPGLLASSQQRLRICLIRAAAAGANQEKQTSEQHVSAQPEHLEVGVILTTHGVKGEVKVQALTDFPEERLLTPGQR